MTLGYSWTNDYHLVITDHTTFQIQVIFLDYFSLWVVPLLESY